MKVHTKLQSATGLLILGTLVGCRHAVLPPPPVAAAPTITTPSTNSITVITPLPSVPPERKADVRPAPIEQPSPTPEPTPVKTVRHLRRKVTTPSSVNIAGETPPVHTEAPPASANGASAVPPVLASSATSSSPSSGSSAAGAAPKLGELSTGTTISGNERIKMLSEIQSQELRLSRLKEVASSEIASVQTQVRSFLAKARQAVTENDLDGAQTLNTKARVLLDELAGE